MRAPGRNDRHPEYRDRTVQEVFEAERPFLAPFVGPFDGFHQVEAVAQATCLINFDRNRYSVEARAARRAVQIANKFSESDRRYRTFARPPTTPLHKRPSPPSPPRPGRAGPGRAGPDWGADDLRPAMSSYNADVRHHHESFFNSTAMVDAHFSRLEHWLTLRPTAPSRWSRQSALEAVP